MTEYHELIVIGGRAGGTGRGLCGVGQGGVRDILILERDKELGGILNQCIHNGFGLTYFKEELTGPEYAGRFIEMLWGDRRAGQDRHDGAGGDPGAGGPRGQHPRRVSGAAGGVRLCWRWAAGERTRGAIGIPGDRPAGVLTAGAAQRYLNIEGYMVGKRVVILGSGDIGLIMARRMTLEGAKVLACVEVMPYSGGLNRKHRAVPQRF